MLQGISPQEILQARLNRKYTDGFSVDEVELRIADTQLAADKKAHQDSVREMLEEIENNLAEELFNVWKEAKSFEEDDWNDTIWASLPEKHKNEYQLTAKRIAEAFKKKYLGE